MNVVIENGKAFASPKGWRDKESGFAGFCRAGGNVVKPGFPAILNAIIYFNYFTNIVYFVIC